MSQDPGYVRLVDRMVRGCQVDIRSGWSIAGLDVREFPTDDYPLAQNFVRERLRTGVLEGCSKAEFEEVMDAESNDSLAAAGVTVNPVEIEGHYQEAHVVGHANDRRRTLEASRGLGTHGLSYSDDKVRRQRLIDRQNEIDSGGQLEDADEPIDTHPGGEISSLVPNPTEASAGSEDDGGDEAPAKKTATRKRAAAKS